MPNQNHSAKIAVAIDAVPRLMNDLLLAELSKAGDIEIVAESFGPSPRHIDVLLTISTATALQKTALSKLINRPNTVVLILTEDGKTLNRAVLKVHHETLEQPSISDVVAAIRQTAARGGDLPHLNHVQESRS